MAATRSTGTELAFEALEHENELRVVNPHGDVGLIALWSPLDRVAGRLGELAPHLLDPARSRLAVLGNLYGAGMSAMLRNLLYNPQVRHLVALGSTPRGLTVADELAALLRDGVEETTVLGVPYLRIRGFGRTLQVTDGFDVERLRATLSFRDFGTLAPAKIAAVDAYVAALPRARALPPRIRVSNEVRLPSFRPSEVHGHQVVRDTPLACWDELLARVLGLGRPLEIKGTQRLELLNVKAVIAEPRFEPEEVLRDRGFEPADLRAYQARMLDPRLRAVGEDEAPPAYTYGHRLLTYFGHDQLARAAERLGHEPTAHLSLWDNAYDLGGDHSNPCLVTLFLRRDGGALSLTATFRAHNLLDAWLPNAYGLIAVLEHVAARAGLRPGPLTIISHSLSARVGADRFPVAQALVEARTEDDFDRPDPNGRFRVFRAGGVVAEHWDGDRLLARYRGEDARAVRTALSRDFAVSLPAHGLQLGARLAAAEPGEESDATPDPPAVFPSDVRSHFVSRRTAAEAWDELAARIARFGRGLLDVKTVITAPDAGVRDAGRAGRDPGNAPDSDSAHGRPAPGAGHAAEGETAPGAGHAVVRGAALGREVDVAVERLRRAPDTRDAYVAVPGDGGLASLFFRRSEDALTLTATFRDHTHWLSEAQEAAALLHEVAQRAGVAPGALVIISHTLDVAPDGARPRKGDDDVDASGTVTLRQDPHGNFAASTDGGRLVVQHVYNDAVVATYTGATADTIVREVSRRFGVSLISNALWLGAELKRLEPSTSSP